MRGPAGPSILCLKECEMDYISKETRQYKANLHCHSNLSDGKLTLEALAAAYRERGYSVLAVTDHEAPWDHTELSTPELLMLTGYEAYIRPSPDCVIDRYGPEIHLNLLAKNPHNTTFIAYDPKFCKYMPHETAETRKKAGDLGPRRYDRAYIQAFIAAARAAGYLVTYNHPCWSMEDPNDILAYDGFFSMEVYNTGSALIGGYEWNMALYDRLLRHGRFVGVHGADDNHNKYPFGHPLCDSFGSWTMILAPELTYPAVVAALEEGRYYASTGPEITRLSFDGAGVRLECTPAARIVMHLSPKYAHNVCDPGGGAVTGADFVIPESAPYVYFSVLGKDGRAARTRAFRREELGLEARG